MASSWAQKYLGGPAPPSSRPEGPKPSGWATKYLAPPAAASGDDENRFRSWYAEHAQQLGLDPNPDAPEHFYDYRAAWKAGAGPDASGHWPSEFKREGHPRRVLGIADTKTGQPVRPAWAAGAPTAEQALEAMPGGLGAFLQGIAETGANLERRLLSGQAQLAASLAGAAEAAGRGTANVVSAVSPEPIGDAAQWIAEHGTPAVAEKIRETAEAAAAAIAPPQEGDLFSQLAGPRPAEALLGATLENVSQLAATAGATLAAGPAGGLAMAGALEGGGAYREALEAGAPEEQAQRAAIVTAAVNAPLDYLPVSRLLRPAFKGMPEKAFRAVFSQIAGQAASEGGTEALQAVNTKLAVLAASAPEAMDWRRFATAFSPENLRAYGAEGLVGMLLGGAGSAVATGATPILGPQPETPTEVPQSVTLPPEVAPPQEGPSTVGAPVAEPESVPVPAPREEAGVPTAFSEAPAVPQEVAPEPPAPPALTEDEIRRARKRDLRIASEIERRRLYGESVEGALPQLTAEAGMEPPSEPSPQAARPEAPAQAEAEPVSQPAAGAAAPEMPQVVDLPREAIDIEPERFQFKDVVNQRGETGRLFSVKAWDPRAASQIRVWRDPDNGGWKLIDGHQRLGLYDRLGATAPIRAQVVEASSAEDARLVGALLNLKEGSGSAWDAAKLFRSQPNLTPELLEEEGVALTEGIVRRGLALRGLEPFLFREGVTGRLREPQAVILGEELADSPEHQVAVYKQIAARETTGKPLQDGEVRTLARLAKAAGSTSFEAAQQDLFGAGPQTASLMEGTLGAYKALEREFLGARRDLAALSRERVAQRAEAEEIGKIDVRRGAEKLRAAATEAELFERLGYSQPFSGYVTEAARRITSGEPESAVLADTRARFRAEFARILAPAGAREGESGAPRSEAPERAEPSLFPVESVAPPGASAIPLPAPAEAPGLFGSSGGNLFSTIFGDPRAPLKLGPKAIASARAEVEQRWQAARGIRAPGILARTKEAIAQLGRSFRRADVTLDPKKNPENARAADILRLHRSTDHYAKAIAFSAVDEITSGLTPEQGDLLTRLTVLPDIARSALLYAAGRELPFGYRDAAEVEADLGRFRELADAPENAPVKKALETRERVRREVVQRLVAAKFLPPDALDNPGYYHRQVMAYADRLRVGSGASSVRIGKKGFQRERKGGGDFNTDFQQAEFEWLADATQVLEKKATLDALQANSDIRGQLETEAKVRFGDTRRWRELVPEGYTTWQAQKGNRLFPALSIPEGALQKILRGEKELAQEDVREVLALGGREEWVVPEDIAATLERMAVETPKAIERFVVGAQASWKQWTLLNPVKAIRYNLNNLSGDLDIALAISPKLLRTAPRWGRDLWAYHLGRNASPNVRERIHRLQRLGVFDSGLTIEEIPDLHRAGMLRSLTDSRPGPVSRSVQLYWKGVKGFSVWRENILRGAAYDYFLAEWEAGRKRYGASTPSEIDAIADLEQRAAKLAREAIGDYGNVSEAGRWVRRHMIPFYSWLEINAPRYARLLRNASREGRTAKAGAAVAVGVGTRGVASLALRASILYGTTWIWNHLFFPNEEEEMGEARREPHIIFGRDDTTGEILSLRFQGALADALDWFNLADLPEDVAEVAEEPDKAIDKAAEAAKAPAEKLLVGFEPFSKTLFELASGRSMYPTPFRKGRSFELSPRPIYDRPGHVARTFSLDKLWNVVTNRPRRPGGGLDSLILYRTDPGEAAYWHARQLADDWLREQGKGSGYGGEKNPRQLALYYFKKASQWGDEERARYWLDKYHERGGTDKGMQQSIDRSAPLGGIAKKDRRGFRGSLAPEELEAVALAERWYEQRME